MKERYYLVSIIVVMISVLFVVLFVNLNSLNNSIYSREGTVSIKYFDQELGCYIVNCTGKIQYEIKNGAYQSNSTQTYESINENQTYIFKIYYDTQTNMWNIINATLVAK
jgi:hypothetical protein